MAVTGNKKQETKITEMGMFTTDMFPNIDIISAKGAFRFGIKSALKNSSYKNWKEIAERTSFEREKFFETLVENSLPYLINAELSKKQTKKIFVEIKKENKKYLT